MGVAVLLWALLLAGCATHRAAPESPAVADDPFLRALVQDRAWGEDDALPPTVGEQSARVKFLGVSEQDARLSLALKLQLIDSARWSVDLADYILRDDFSGRSVLAALCRAAGRGVDVRVLVDSLGSWSMHHAELKQLKRCERSAGFILDRSGRPTAVRARIEIGIINALSNVLVRWNRRSHDKLLVVDGLVAEHAVVITGGRNLAGDYFALKPDGQPSSSGYRDLEIVVRPHDDPSALHAGQVATRYFTSLLRNPGNRRIRDRRTVGAEDGIQWAIAAAQSAAHAPALEDAWRRLPEWQAQEWVDAQVHFANELPNLHRQGAVSRALESRDANDASIRGIAVQHLEIAHPQRIRIVSPYLFLAHYPARRGRPEYDEARLFLDYLERHPQATLEIVTNSPLTSDNPLAQAFIDMDTIPRLLLAPEDAEAWRRQETDLAALATHPRLAVYTLGRNDAQALGGPTPYGKLHAKFLVTEHGGFVGTDNFDYRSRLLNSEIGYFFRSDAAASRLNAEFDQLKAMSLRWGSEEWLALRRTVAVMPDQKGTSLRWQRRLYRVSRVLHLGWLY